MPTFPSFPDPHWLPDHGCWSWCHHWCCCLEVGLWGKSWQFGVILNPKSWKWIVQSVPFTNEDAWVKHVSFQGVCTTTWWYIYIYIFWIYPPKPGCNPHHRDWNLVFSRKSPKRPSFVTVLLVAGFDPMDENIPRFRVEIGKKPNWKACVKMETSQNQHKTLKQPPI